jgi:hypothetical protein
METPTQETASNGRGVPARESVGELIAETIQDASALGRSEAEFVKAEIADGARRAAVGAALLGAAVVAGLVTIGMLAAAATLGLATAMPAWLAALIVAAVCGLAGGMLVLVGTRSLRSASDEITTSVVQRIREDVQWLKHRMKPESE